MKQYTIAIPDDKEAFFQEFMRMAGVFVIESGDTDIPQWHVDLVKERVATTSDQNMLNWDEAKKRIKLD